MAAGEPLVTRPPEPRPRLVPVEDVAVGDRLVHAGVQLEVHRIAPRPSSGVALIVIHPGRPWDGRRLFYKLGEHVEVVR